MKIVGLTGGSGSGKGTVSNIFCLHKDVISVDADIVYQKLCKTNQEMIFKLNKVFGDILNEDQTLNRKKLAKIVFSDQKKLEKLNEITLPFIKEASFAIFQKNKEKKIILFDAPTLFQTGLDSFCETTVGVLAEKDIRCKRIMERDNISKEMAELRINAQPDNAFFRQNCDYIVINNHDIHSLQKQVDILYLILTKEY